MHDAALDELLQPVGAEAEHLVEDVVVVLAKLRRVPLDARLALAEFPWRPRHPHDADARVVVLDVVLAFTEVGIDRFVLDVVAREGRDARRL